MADDASRSAPIAPPAIVIRKQAIADKSVHLQPVLADLGFRDAPTETADLVLLGPLFGAEAVMAVIRALEGQGLVYVDDFYAVEVDLPDWLRLSASCA